MHIMEGMLPFEWAVFWWILTAIILIAGIIQLNKIVRQNREVLPLLAVSGAFIFVLSCLKMPSVTGSSSHPTGTGLSTITFGPLITAVISAIVLFFQAVLLAHGGVSTLGANCFSMGFFGPLLAYGLYKLLQKTKLHIYITVFLAAFVADLATYVLTSLQLALASVINDTVIDTLIENMPTYLENVPASIGALVQAMPALIQAFIEASAGFLGIFAVTQLPLAILEGLIIVVAFKYIAKVKGDFLLKTETVTEEQIAQINS